MNGFDRRKKWAKQTGQCLWLMGKWKKKIDTANLGTAQVVGRLLTNAFMPGNCLLSKIAQGCGTDRLINVFGSMSGRETKRIRLFAILSIVARIGRKIRRCLL